MVLSSDVVRYGFEMKNGEFQSVEKTADGMRPLWIVDIRYMPDKVSAMLRVQNTVIVKDKYFLRTKFDGIVKTPNDITWVMNAVGVVNKG